MSWTGWAPTATRIPNSLIRFETEYIAIPKTPVTASMTANKPITPSVAVATRAGNNTSASASGQVWKTNGKVGSICASVRLSSSMTSTVDSCDRSTRDV